MSKINNTKITHSIVYGLAISAILAFGLIILPLKANAQYYDDGYSYNEPNQIPIVNSISPNVANVGDGANNVTITGSGFVPGSVARWNGANRPTTFIDYEHLLVQLSASDLRGSSGRYINVFTPAPGGGYSNAELLSINGYVGSAANTYNNSNSIGYDYNSNLYTNTDNNYYNYQNTTQTENRNSANQTPNENSSSLVGNAIFGSGGVAPSGLIQWVLFAIIILIIVIIVRKIFGGTDRYHNTPLKHS